MLSTQSNSTVGDRRAQRDAVEQARLASFAAELDALRREVDADLGEQDAEHIRRLGRLSRRFEIVGRSLITLSIDPLTFSAGVVALAIHKQVEAIDIGHAVLHGAYDRVSGAEAFRAEGYVWRNPISEEAWRYEHNVVHHGFTNVATRDPDVHLGFLRMVPSTPHHPFHWFQIPIVTFVILPNFMAMLNGHAAGLADWYMGFTRVLRDRSPASKRRAHRLTADKWIRYVAKEYGLFGALAGPFLPKVMLGNFLAGALRDVWGGLTILMTHTGEDVETFEDVSHSSSRGEFFERTARATQNVTMSPLASLLFGRLGPSAELSTVDYHIEHHLFPKLPLGRLRQLAPRVREICESHGVPYRTIEAGPALRSLFRKLLRFSMKE